MSGALAAPIPKVSGTVLAAVPDGRDGWFIGGNFTAVGGVQCRNLAHIFRGGRVSSWAPNPDAAVRALAVERGTLYVGGDFNTIDATARARLAAFTALFGRLTRWDPTISGVGYFSTQVTSIVIARDRIFVGGDFAAVGGQPRRNLAAIRIRDGIPLPWGPDPDARVESLVLAGRTLYVGGNFGHIGGAERKCIAALDASTAQVLPWDPGIDNTVVDDVVGTTVSSMAIFQERLVVAGHFSVVADSIRGGLAQVDLCTGASLAWNPNPIDPSRLLTAPLIYAVAVDGGDVLVGGLFTDLGGVDRRNVAAADAITAQVRGWAPNTDRAVHALAISRGGIYVGGEFGILGCVPRGHLAAFDSKSGILLDWDPDVQGFYVDALSTLGSTLYCGGYFFSIDGQARGHIAAFDMKDGRLSGWNPGADGPISSVAATAACIFAAGQFQQIGGASRGYVAAIDPASGAATAWAPLVDDIVNVVLPRDSVIFLGGWFGSVDGSPRARLAAVDAISGGVEPWSPGACGPVFSLAMERDTVFAAGSFSFDGFCDNGVAAFDEQSGANAWLVRADGQVRSVACDSLAVYAGGQFSRVGEAERRALAAFGRGSGEVLDWDPGCDGVVWSLEEIDGVLYAGGGFTSVGLEPRSNLAVLPRVSCPAGGLAGSFGDGACTRREVALAPQNPAGDEPIIRFMLPSAQVVSIEIFDVQGRVVAVPVRKELRDAGRHSIMIHAEGWSNGFYCCRLVVGDAEVTRKFLVLR